MTINSSLLEHNRYKRRMGLEEVVTIRYNKCVNEHLYDCILYHYE